MARHENGRLHHATGTLSNGTLNHVKATIIIWGSNVICQ